VAWAEFGTPEQLPNIHHRKQYLEGVVAPPNYRITCIYVYKKHRKAGLAAAALRGGAGSDRRRRWRSGRGVPPGHARKKVNPSFLYNGTRHMYEEAGFTYDRPKGKNHCVMTRVVDSLS
jgi:hypothetical protein